MIATAARAADVTLDQAQEVIARRALEAATEALEHARGPEAQERAMDDVIAADATHAYWRNRLGTPEE